MDSVRYFALRCCILSTLAGMIRTFWPDGALKSVINSVLTLYIIASVLQGVTGADWLQFAGDLRDWAQQGTAIPDYSGYLEELGTEESAKALQDLLRHNGIESTVLPEQDGIRVRLVYPADREEAAALLEEYGGGIRYTLEDAQ